MMSVVLLRFFSGFLLSSLFLHLCGVCVCVCGMGEGSLLHKNFIQLLFLGFNWRIFFSATISSATFIFAQVCFKFALTYSSFGCGVCGLVLIMISLSSFVFGRFYKLQESLGGYCT
jgi:hypothetical protein